MTPRSAWTWSSPSTTRGAGAITTAQNIQLAATTERLRGVTLFTEWNEPLVAEGPRMDANGTVAVPTAPGNGFAVDLSCFDDPLFEITA